MSVTLGAGTGRLYVNGVLRDTQPVTLTAGPFELRPTGLNGTVNQDRRLVLHWDPQSDANSWQVHELLKDPANTLKATVTTPMSTRGPLAGGKYTYGIMAISADGQSPMSPTVGTRMHRARSAHHLLPLERAEDIG